MKVNSTQTLTSPKYIVYSLSFLHFAAKTRIAESREYKARSYKISNKGQF